MTTTIREILAEKGSTCHSVAPETNVLEALGLMMEFDIAALLVMQGNRLVGIFTERDYARKVALRGRTSKETRVGDLMTENVLTIAPSYTLEDCMAIMTHNRIRHLPVVTQGQLVGIISIGDVVKAMLSEREATIHHLSSYIAGDLAA